VLKSGRLSPYFFNTGSLDDGEGIMRLGHYFAAALLEQFGREGFDVIFGPAYKGIPLAVAIAASLFKDFSVVKKFSFNRKEAKDHGEKGSLMGHLIAGGERVCLSMMCLPPRHQDRSP